MLFLKVLLLLLYLIILVLTYRCIDYINWNDLYNVATVIDPFNLSLRQLQCLLHLRGVSYLKAIEKKDLSDLVITSGVVTKDEVAFAEMMDKSSYSDAITFTGVEELDASLATSEDVWLVQIVNEKNQPQMSALEWSKLKKRSNMIGVRIGQVFCQASPVLCESRSFLSSQLLLSYHYENNKRGIHRKHYLTRPTNCGSAFHWMSTIFHDVIEEVPDELLPSEVDINSLSVRVVYVSTGVTIPAIFVPLKLRFRNNVKFGKILSTNVTQVVKPRNLDRKQPNAVVCIQTPKYDVLYGSLRGEIISFPHLYAHLRALNPDINFCFTWSVYICNFLGALSFLTTKGPLFSRFVAVVKSAIAYNVVLLGAWLIVSSCKLDIPGEFADRLWTIIHGVGNRRFVSLILMDLIEIYQYFYTVLAGFMLFFCSCLAALRRSNLISSETETVGGLSDLLLNDMRDPARNDISQRWIERLATPELWLQPLVPSQYIEDLPVWEYTGPSVCSSDESDQDRSKSPYRTASPSPNREIVESQQCRTRGRSYFAHSTRRTTSRITRGLIQSIRSCLRGRSPRVRKTPGPPDGMRRETCCSICLENFRYRAHLCGLPCRHVFHHSCILSWLYNDKHCCPVCRWPSYRPKSP